MKDAYTVSLHFPDLESATQAWETVVNSWQPKLLRVTFENPDGTFQTLAGDPKGGDGDTRWLTEVGSEDRKHEQQPMGEPVPPGDREWGW